MNTEPIDLNRRRRAAQATKAVKIGALCAAAALVLLIVLLNSVYVVGENEQAVLSRFGVIQEVVLSPTNDFTDQNPELMNAEDTRLQNVTIVKDKGLRFKLPFVTSVQIYDGRLNTFTSNAEPVNTADKKQYYVTIFGQWQIANPALFSITQQNMFKVEQYLDNLVFPVIVQNINNLNASDFVNNKDMLNQTLDQALETINDTVKESGIRFKDIQVNRTLLPDANMQSTYERMIANRAKVAQQLRSEGEEEYNKAVAAADRDARVLTSDAVRDAERIKGEGDAEALAIYADAYSVDPEFYSYWRSLQALENALKENTTLVLDEDNPLWADLLRYVSETQADTSAPAPTRTPEPEPEPETAPGENE